MRLITIACAFALVSLSACDAVQVPGINPKDRTGQGTPVQTIPASEPLSGQSSENGPAAPEPAPAAALPTPPVVQSEEVYRPVPSLGAINSIRCGLPDGAAPTPTISTQAQARTGPQPESLVTVSAVGAAAVQSLTQFPGIVKMEPRRFEGNAIASGHCAATRIAERWFLTAAHCVDDGYDEIQFIAGTPNLRDMASARVFNADTSICHAGYAGFETNFINDIALVRVPEDALPALMEVPIAEFGITDRPLGDYHYATGEMAGWGTTGFDQPLSPLLLSAELTIVSASPSLIVIASRDGSGPCIGDSGGPLYITEDDGQRTVVGVLSVVEQASGQNVCEGNYQGRYTNVAGYRDWISAVMETCHLQPALCDLPATAIYGNDGEGPALSLPLDDNGEAPTD